MANARLFRYLDPDYVCDKNASGSWQIYWGNCISSLSCRPLPGQKLRELCALKKQKIRWTYSKGRHGDYVVTVATVSIKTIFIMY